LYHKNVAGLLWLLVRTLEKRLSS